MKIKMYYRNLKKIPVVILTIIIFILSSRTQPIPPAGEYYIDYFYVFLHMGEFGLFAMLLMLGFYPKIKLHYLIGISLLYGVLDEVHQYFVPTRWCDIVDVISNSIGSILGIIGFFVLIMVYNYFFIFPKIR